MTNESQKLANACEALNLANDQFSGLSAHINSVRCLIQTSENWEADENLSDASLLLMHLKEYVLEYADQADKAALATHSPQPVEA